MLEKHHDWLRMQYLKTKTQCEHEGLNFTKEQLLSVCLTAKNSLFTVGKSTPMQAVFGRQPAILPSMEQGDAVLDDDNGTPGLSRHTIRVREIAIENMLQVSAQQRVVRALRNKSRRAIQSEQFQPGDQVEIFRQPANKDTSGWRGPCSITHVSAAGTVHIQWQGSAMICRAADVRRALTYFSFLTMLLSSSDDMSYNTPFDLLRRFVSQ